jgi:hypothetical protein
MLDKRNGHDGEADQKAAIDADISSLALAVMSYGQL